MSKRLRSKVKWSIYGHRKMDKAPGFEIISEKYIVRAQTYPNCPRKSSGKTAQKYFALSPSCDQK